MNYNIMIQLFWKSFTRMNRITIFWIPWIPWIRWTPRIPSIPSIINNMSQIINKKLKIFRQLDLKSSFLSCLHSPNKTRRSNPRRGFHTPRMAPISPSTSTTSSTKSIRILMMRKIWRCSRRTKIPTWDHSRVSCTDK